MRKSLIAVATFLFLAVTCVSGVSAATAVKFTPSVVATQSATVSAEASTSASPNISSASAAVQEKIQEKSDRDITEVTGKTKDSLAEVLDKNPVQPLSWYNFLQHAIRRSVANGLPANLIVLILLFPLIALVIAFSRHVIGLKGFGVYTPAVLSVAFVSTGIVNGLILFVVILFAALLTRRILLKLKLQYLPRTAMLFWGVSVMLLVILIASSFLQFSQLLTVNFFPVLIMILLTENFMETQLMSSQSEAIELSVETLITAILCSVIIGAPMVQRYVILQPELTLIGVAAINILIGKYSGLRLLEWIRFRAIIDQS